MVTFQKAELQVTGLSVVKKKKKKKATSHGSRPFLLFLVYLAPAGELCALLASFCSVCFVSYDPYFWLFVAVHGFYISVGCFVGTMSFLKSRELVILITGKSCE